jgi:plasmid stabilization system protein ParE
MKRVIVSARAERDLSEILAYIAKDSPVQAAIMVDRLERAALDLAGTAAHYQLLPHAHIKELRRRVVTPYNIIYSIDGDDVNVLHFFHGARQFRLLYPMEAPDD